MISLLFVDSSPVPSSILEILIPTCPPTASVESSDIMLESKRICELVPFPKITFTAKVYPSKT